MELLRDFFVGLARFIYDTLFYLVDGLLNDPEYREGFAAGVIFLIVLVVLNSIIGWAWARVIAYQAMRQPSFVPTAPAAQLGRGCLLGGLVLSFLGLLLAGIILGVLAG